MTDLRADVRAMRDPETDEIVVVWETELDLDLREEGRGELFPEALRDLADALDADGGRDD